MHSASDRAFRIVLAAAVSLAALSCSKDDIPSTAPPPFLFTNVLVSKFVSPAASTVLVHGTAYVAKFEVAYTLTDSDFAARNSIEVRAVVNSHDVNGNFLAVIGNLAFTPPPITTQGGVLTDSIAFTVPASGAGFISVGARIVPKSTAITDGGKIGPFWSVK